jgi:hypothetical protein
VQQAAHVHVQCITVCLGLAWPLSTGSEDHEPACTSPYCLLQFRLAPFAWKRITYSNIMGLKNSKFFEALDLKILVVSGNPFESVFEQYA